MDITKGTVLVNKRSGREVRFIKSYMTIGKHSDWKWTKNLWCKNVGKAGWTNILCTQLSRWETK